jgi:hypothetical protein
MQRIHPVDSEGKSGCDPKVLEMLEKMNSQEQDKTNPIWKGLEKFKDN